MKKLFSLLLALALLLSLFACSDEPPAPNDGGDTAPAPQANPVTDFEYSVSRQPDCIGITKYVGTSTSIVFPETIDGLPVTIIGGYLLYDSDVRYSIESVVIPDTVETVANMTFSGCKSLVSVDFGEGVRSIGESAFENCTALKKVILPPCLESIGASAFSYCTAVEEVFIPKTVVSWNYHGGEGGPFSGNEKPGALKKITIEDGLVSLGSKDGAGIFSNAPLLEELVIPASVKSIEPYAFHSCTGLKSVTFLGDAPEVKAHVFGYVNTETSSKSLVIYYDPATEGWDDTVLREYQLVPIE